MHSLLQSSVSHDSTDKSFQYSDLVFNISSYQCWKQLCCLIFLCKLLVVLFQCSSVNRKFKRPAFYNIEYILKCIYKFILTSNYVLCIDLEYGIVSQF